MVQEADDNPFDNEEDEEEEEEQAEEQQREEEEAPAAPDNPFEEEEVHLPPPPPPPPVPKPVRTAPSTASADGQPLSARVELLSEGSASLRRSADFAALPPGSPAPGSSNQPSRSATPADPLCAFYPFMNNTSVSYGSVQDDVDGKGCFQVEAPLQASQPRLLAGGWAVAPGQHGGAGGGCSAHAAAEC